MSHTPFLDDGEVEEVFVKFESGELPVEAFKHREHLTVALVYLLRHAPEEAHRRMRDGIHSFLRAHGEDPAPVYHETLTVFWMRRVGAFVERAGRGRPVGELANELAKECGEARLAFDYFSKGLIDTEEARRGWVEPDLKPLDF
ncbi:MAG TPA: hypothetical protein VGX48_26185 [Pyrinomonadaceae bacterium]|jgi:hypothetical protein|nr:hypothetical protein [Pyrinomonadaceae bacterium]